MMTCRPSSAQHTPADLDFEAEHRLLRGQNTAFEDSGCSSTQIQGDTIWLAPQDRVSGAYFGGLCGQACALLKLPTKNQGGIYEESGRVEQLIQADSGCDCAESGREDADSGCLAAADQGWLRDCGGLMYVGK
jgi:hypothetical protein